MSWNRESNWTPPFTPYPSLAWRRLRWWARHWSASVTQVPLPIPIYIPIYILFSVHLKQGEQKVNIFGGINLQYNIDSFWKNGSLGPYFDISERREFFEKVQGEQKVNIFGGFNLHYNIDAFWKNGSIWTKMTKTGNFVHLNTDNFVHLKNMDKNG